MLTLYHAPKSRSTRFLWLLEELGAPYKVETVNIRRGDGSGTQDGKDPHPHGKVPAIDDDGVIIFESAAIAVYLTDKFPKAGLGPVIGDARRGPYLTWLAYYAGVMEPAFMSKFMQADVPRGTAGWVKVEEVMEFVNDTLAKGPYLLGENFSAADILVGSTFGLFLNSPMMQPLKTKALEDYVKRCTERPAFQKTVGKELGNG